MKIDIKGIDKTDLFVALYNEAKPLGMGYLHYDPKPIVRAEVPEMLQSLGMALEAGFFDYVKGRVMKVNIMNDEMDSFLYNRDNGEGMVEKIVAKLRAK